MSTWVSMKKKQEEEKEEAELSSKSVGWSTHTHCVLVSFHVM
jgi:hypothetical protein